MSWRSSSKTLQSNIGLSLVFVWCAHLYLQSGNYGKAFAACRKHRIDLNVLVDDNCAKFVGKVSLFVEQVHDVDFINLFLTSVGYVCFQAMLVRIRLIDIFRQGLLPAEDITLICDSVRMVLEKKDLKMYINSILTAHVVKNPPDHEAGLALLLQLRGQRPYFFHDFI